MRPHLQFLSTPSARRATLKVPVNGFHNIQFLSTPSARRATLISFVSIALFKISIHALREEGDDADLADLIFLDISIHALREEGDACTTTARRSTRLFLSTPSARRATAPCCKGADQSQNFYPRPPRGGRPCRAQRRRHESGISIHALREEGDRRQTRLTSTSRSFLSTPSARRATKSFPDAESNLLSFLSTPSARRATSQNTTKNNITGAISIHALREEGDYRGNRRNDRQLHISIHALREEGDLLSLFSKL